MNRNLTDRQLQLLEMAQKGMKNRDIALKLGLAEKSIKTYFGHIYQRLGVRNKKELLSMYQSGTMLVHTRILQTKIKV